MTVSTSSGRTLNGAAAGSSVAKGSMARCGAAHSAARAPAAARVAM